ncbi:hypothetical protein X907_1744 [Glycocaulis alkaliphilus]|uniref:Uncharacterized protein n=1 Tax=Glycocaulis alkaliphilus TaxID=1434191 RepID=A0A3T0E9Z6_9PROT|nr:hypothetical protein X907_1744 [Glycocaulis alkaliphilus]
MSLAWGAREGMPARVRVSGALDSRGPVKTKAPRGVIAQGF